MIMTQEAHVEMTSMMDFGGACSGTSTVAVAELWPSLSKAEVAELTVSEIANLPAENLACAVRTAELRFLQGNRPTRLESLDRDALERLAYLARRCCRNQGY